MNGYKAFYKGMVCNGKQYAENTDYEEHGGEICSAGMMHFCKEPFQTLTYYPLIDGDGEFTEFAEVEALDEVIERDDKCATKKIHIGAKLSFKDFIKAGVDVLIEKTKLGKVKKDTNLSDNGMHHAQIGSSGDCAKIGSSGYGAQIGSSGDYARIGSSGYGAKIGSSGDCPEIGSSGNGARIGSSGYAVRIGSSGDCAKIGSSGGCAKIGSSGDWPEIGSSGNYAQIGSSGYGAKIGSSGDYARIGSSGNGAKIGSSGYGAQINMQGERSVAAAVGDGCVIKGKMGDWIVLAEWKEDSEGKRYPAYVKSGQIDGKSLLPDTWYGLKDGVFVDC